MKLGSPRPEIGSRAGVAALRARADAHAEALAPALRELLLSNPTASLRDLAALLEQLELPTPRRGRWGPSAVRNALRRAGARAADAVAAGAGARARCAMRCAARVLAARDLGDRARGRGRYSSTASTIAATASGASRNTARHAISMREDRPGADRPAKDLEEHRLDHAETCRDPHDRPRPARRVA